MREIYSIVFLMFFSVTPLYAKPLKSRRQPKKDSTTITIEVSPSPPPWTKNGFNALEASAQSLYMITTVPKMIDQSEAGKVTLKRIPASAGQAFLVDKNLLMSANHITENLEVGDKVWVWNQKTITFGTIVYQHPIVDFVLIEADLPNGVPLLLKKADQYNYEQAIVFLGNFYQFGVGPMTIERIAKIVRVRNEIPAMLGKEAVQQSPSSYLVFEGVFKEGDSGAPVFNQDGYVIGMLTMIAKNKPKDELGNGITIGVPSRVLLFLYTEYLLEKAKKLANPEN